MTLRLSHLPIAHAAWACRTLWPTRGRGLESLVFIVLGRSKAYGEED